MGYLGRYQEKLLAQDLRRAGLSYSEILLQVPVSKDTLSRWCRDIQLTENQKLVLQSKKSFGQHKGSIVAADNKRTKRIYRTQQIFQESKNSLGYISERDFFVAGIALYCGEGDKADGKGAFTNADPRLIKFMMEWFRVFCKVPESRFRGAIWLHEDLSEEKALEFWSKLTGIPSAKFHKTYIAKIEKNGTKMRKNIHEYGVFSIRFSCTDIHRQIMGWISALVGDKILSTF